MTDSNKSGRWRWGTIIFVVAMAVRAAFIVGISSAPFFKFRIGDARAYHEWAHKIASGDLFGDGVFYQAPLYPYVLSLVYAILGDNRIVVAVCQSILGAAGCVLLFDATSHLFSRPAGVVAGLALACYAPAVFCEGLVQKDSLGLFFAVSTFWVLVRLVIREHAGYWLLLGVVLGCFSLLRENALVLIPALLVWVVVHFGGGSRWTVRRLGMFFLGLALVLGPVLLRNRLAGGELHLTTSQSGPNFYIGNNERANGLYAPLQFGRGDARFEREDATRIAEHELQTTLTPAQVSAYWWQRAWDFIWLHPKKWLMLMCRKFALVWNAAEIADTEDIYAYADYSFCLASILRGLHFGVLTPLAVAGLIVTWRERARLWVFYLVAFTYSVSIALFFVLARYRLPLVPLLCAFAGPGLVAAWRQLRSRSWHGLGVPVIAALIAAVACNWPFVSIFPMRAVTYFNFGTQFDETGDLRQAQSMYQKAIELDPPFAFAHYNLGNCLIREGHVEEAAAHFEAALAADARFAAAAVNLGNTWLERGDARQSIPLFERALAIDPLNAQAHNGLGMAYSRLREFPQAVFHFEQASRLAPDIQDIAIALEQARREVEKRPVLP